MREFIEGMIATERAVCPVCGEQQYKDINIAEEGCEEVWVRMKALCTCEYEKKQEADRTIRKLERQSRIDYLKRRHLPEKRHMVSHLKKTIVLKVKLLSYANVM